MKFTDFNLDENLLRGIEDAGYTDCMPVQEKVLEAGLGGADLYVQSQTGSGKTAAYLVTVFERMLKGDEGKTALIMAPTRELAVQIEEEAKILSAHTHLKPASFYGGVGYERQVAALKEGANVLIGTPGRVIDLQKGGQMKLGQTAFLVIDEADRMFDMGFYPDLRSLIKFLPPAAQRQTMLFSATLNTWVKNLSWDYTEDPVEVTIEAENVTVDEIEQALFHVASDEKMRLLCGIIKKESPESLIIFCNTKRMAEVVAKRLKINGINADYLIGDLPQVKRLKVINAFKEGELKCLVATDVAARGLDVEDLAMVVNFDLPEEAENYVHRIGRTARAGKTGKAYSFCCEHDVYNLPAIERYIDQKIPVAALTDESFAEDKSANIYIKLDHYEGDNAGDDSKRRAASARGKSPQRSHGRGAGSKKPFAANSAAKGKDERAQGAKRGKRPEYAAQGRGVRKSEEELARLSFEERMRYYQEKYGQERHKAAASPTRTTAASSAKQSAGVQGAKQASGKRKKSAQQAGAKGQTVTVKTEARGKARSAMPQNGAKGSHTKNAGSAPAKDEAAKPIEAQKAPERGIRGLLRKLFGTRGK